VARQPVDRNRQGEHSKRLQQQFVGALYRQPVLLTQPANSNSSSTIVFLVGSLYGLNDSNPFNPAFQPQGTGVGQVPGGIITFGGGVALYKSGQVIGGLGVVVIRPVRITQSPFGCAQPPV
jgi:hypothetical protein